MAKLSFRIEADYDKVQRLRDEISKLKQEIKGTDAIQNPTAFNALNNKLQQTSQELGNVTNNIAQASATMETNFRQKIFAASQSVNDFTEKIIAQKGVVKDVAADVKRLGEAYREAQKYSPMSADSKLAEWKAAKKALDEEKAALFSLTQEQAIARLSVSKLRDEYNLFREEGGGTTDTLDLLTSKMKGISATILGGMGLKELAGNIISVRAEFESMETSLKVLLGGSQERLDSIMGQIKEYALASPLNTKDMVGAVQMMTSFGIEAEKSIDYLKAIGDISMGDTGKFNSLALAFSQMSSAGKLMGQDLMQMVNAGFNPLEEISRKTGKSMAELRNEMSNGAISSKMVQDAFISATSAGGKFFGMSANGAETLNGQISMLQESFDNMFNEIGEKGEGVVMNAVKAGTYLVNNYQTVAKVLESVIVVYGTYKAALLLNIALEKAQTISRAASLLGTTSLRVATGMLQKQVAALNITMLANPYVAVAAAIVALVGVMWTWADSTDAVTAANEAFEKSQKKATESQKEYREETERAINTANDDAAATDERRKALNLLIGRYPDIIKKYIDENGHLREILRLKQEIARLDGQKEVGDYQKAGNDAQKAAKGLRLRREAEIKSIADTNSASSWRSYLSKDNLKLVEFGDNWYEKNKGDEGWIGRSTSEQVMFAEQTAKNNIGQANRKTVDNAITSFQDSIKDMSTEELKNILSNLRASKNAKVKKVNHAIFKGMTLTAGDINKLTTIVDGAYTSRTTNKKTTKADLQKQKEYLQNKLDKLSEEDAKGEEGAALKKKIREIENREKKAYSTSEGGKSGKTRGKHNNKTSIQKEQQDHQKALEDLNNKKLAMSQSEMELENQIEQSRIDAMMDDSDKTLATMKLAHKKELEQIEKQKQDYLKKKQEEAKAAFEANTKNKGKVFNMASVTLSKSEQDKFKTIDENTRTKHLNEENEYKRQSIEALNNYLKEYGTFEEKKLAITQEYEEKIRNAASVGEKATLEMQRDKEKEKAKNDDLQNSIDWNGIFSDLQGHTKKYLQGLRNQLQELLNAGNLPIDQMAVISDKINAIDEELGKQQGIWDYIGDRAREHNRLLKEVADAQERLNVAKEEENKANAEVNALKTDIQNQLSKAGVNMDVDDISTSTLNGKIDLTDEKFKEMADFLQKLAVAEGKLTDARKKTTDATNKAAQKEDAAKRDAAQSVADWFTDAQKFIKDKGIDQLPDLLNSVGLGKAGKKVSQGLNAFNSASGAAVDFASGNYIGAALKGISAIKSFGSLLGIGSGNGDKVRETTERLTNSNKELAKRIDSLSDVIGNSAGEKAVYAYATALKAQNEINKNNMDVLKAQMGYHGSHHSNASKADNRVIASYNNDAQLAFKAAGVDSANITGLDSIYSLSPEQLKAIRDFAPNLWKYLTEVGKYDKKEYWNAVVEQAGKTEKLTEKIKNNLTQTTFDNLRSSFLDTLMNMDADASDWSEDFSNKFFKSVINKSVLNDDFDKWLKDFQERWAKKVNSGNVSKKDLDAYRDEYNKKMEEVKKKSDDTAALYGIEGKNSSQKATANGISSITYEQANNIVALTTAGNISRDQIKDILTSKLSSIDVSMRVLPSLATESNYIADELRTIQANSYIELKGIHSDTSSMNKSILAMGRDISDIRDKIKKI